MAQIYELLRVRTVRWLIPKYQHAFGRHPVGVLRAGEEYVPDLHRHTVMARLLSPDNGHPVADVIPLWDARLLHWSCDVITLTDIERGPDDHKGLKTVDWAQRGFSSLVLRLPSPLRQRGHLSPPPGGRPAARATKSTSAR